jgi:excisionase family DNA binding protein
MPRVARPGRRFVSQEEAAEYLGLDVRTIRRQIAAGKLHGYRFGNKIIRIDLHEVEQLLKPIPTTQTG